MVAVPTGQEVNARVSALFASVKLDLMVRASVKFHALCTLCSCLMALLALPPSE